MSFELVTETATSKAIADLAWELHRIQATMQSLDSRLDACNTVALAALDQMVRMADTLIDIMVNLDTRP